MHFVNFLGSWGGRLQEFQETPEVSENFVETLCKKQDELTVSRAGAKTGYKVCKRAVCKRAPRRRLDRVRDLGGLGCVAGNSLVQA